MAKLSLNCIDQRHKRNPGAVENGREKGTCIIIACGETLGMAMLAGQSTTRKKLDKLWMHCHEIWYRYP